MREYGRVFSSFWTSQDVRSMSEDARTLALYLLTSPHTTLVGAFRLPDGYVCEDLQWTPERVSKGFAELSAKGFGNRCETTKWVWIRKFLDWNPPENPNQWKAARKLAAQIPEECSWSAEFQRVFARAAGDPEPSPSKPSETVSEPFRNQEQEQEQEQDISPPSPPKGGGETKSKRERGTRIPLPFPLTADLLDWANQNFPDVDVKAVTAEFEDYWRGVPGQKGCKTDWPATWRNRVREVAARLRQRGFPSQQSARTARPFGT